MPSPKKMLEELFYLILRGRRQQIQVSYVVLLIFAVLLIVVLNSSRNEKRSGTEAAYEEQLRVLIQVQASVNNIKEFVDQQKKQLQEHRSLLQQLKSEKEKLEPLVQAHKQAVEELSEARAERVQSKVRSERLAGFIIGFAVSLIVSLILGLSPSRARKTARLQRSSGKLGGRTGVNYPQPMSRRLEA